jgi:hypothetical protein
VSRDADVAHGAGAQAWGASAGAQARAGWAALRALPPQALVDED